MRELLVFLLLPLIISAIPLNEPKPFDRLFIGPLAHIADFIFSCRESVEIPEEDENDLFSEVTKLLDQNKKMTNEMIKRTKHTENAKVDVELVLLKEEERYRHWEPVWVHIEPPPRPSKTPQVPHVRGNVIQTIGRGGAYRPRPHHTTTPNPKREKPSNRSRIRIFINEPSNSKISEYCREKSNPSVHFESQYSVGDYFQYAILICDLGPPICNNLKLFFGFCLLVLLLVILFCISLAMYGKRIRVSPESYVFMYNNSLINLYGFRKLEPEDEKWFQKYPNPFPGLEGRRNSVSKIVNWQRYARVI